MMAEKRKIKGFNLPDMKSKVYEDKNGGIRFIRRIRKLKHFQSSADDDTDQGYNNAHTSKQKRRKRKTTVIKVRKYIKTI